jgi:hypothetical protein
VVQTVFTVLGWLADSLDRELTVLGGGLADSLDRVSTALGGGLAASTLVRCC